MPSFWLARGTRLRSLPEPIDVLGIANLSLIVRLGADKKGKIEVIDEDGAVSEVSGTYTVDDELKTITLDGDGVEQDLVLDYELVDKDNLTVEFEGADLTQLGIDLGSVASLLANVRIKANLERGVS